MYGIQVWYDHHWRDGIRSYATLNDATARLAELRDVGIVARLKPDTEQ